MSDGPTNVGSALNLRSLLSTSDFLDLTSVGFVFYDENGVVADCNRTVLTWLNAERNNFVGSSALDLDWVMVRDDGTQFEDSDRPGRQTWRTQRPSDEVVMGIDVPNEARRWVSVRSYPALVNGEMRGVIVSYADVTEKVKREHMLDLLTEVNRFVMFATDELSLLEHLCRALVDVGGYALAWVGVASSDDDFDVLCAAGATDYLYDGIASSSKLRETGRGPAGTAYRTGVTQVVNNLDQQPFFEPWRERASAFGLRSGVALAFSPGRSAVLALYHNHVVAFDDVTVAGIEGIMREVEFGAAHMRSVQQTEDALAGVTNALNSQRTAEEARSEAETRFRIAFEENMAPMTFADVDDRILAANDAFCQMVGFTLEEVLGCDSTLFTYPEDVGITEETHRRVVAGEADHFRYTKRYLCKDGRIIVVEVSRSTARDAAGNALYFVFSERDVTEERELVAQLAHQALHDPLTGTVNRVLFEDRLSQAHARVQRQGGLGAVLLLDLDDFKGVNDVHGHHFGDQLLSSVAHRLEEKTRSSDTLCRFGADEFLYLADGLKSADEAELVARRLLESLTEPIVILGVPIEQRASIGVVIWDGTSADSTNFVQDADVAMYEAKHHNKGHYVVFTPEMHERATSRFALVQDLRRALHAGEISMHYQPIIDLSTNQVSGFEALMRWQHPERGRVPPDVFIALAENNDLIVELGYFALREAIAQAVTWSSDGGDGPYVTVNLSAHQFHDPSLASVIAELLAQSGLAPQRLIIEITESVTLVDVAETLSVVEHLNRLGIGIALDDFGTGYSSLSYLTLLHPQIIKIDQSFVSPTLESVANDTLLKTIISLGHQLNTLMIAEGIETRTQLDRLRLLDCDLGQGFLFSPAVPVGEIEAIMRQWQDGWE